MTPAATTKGRGGHRPRAGRPRIHPPVPCPFCHLDQSASTIAGHLKVCPSRPGADMVKSEIRCYCCGLRIGERERPAGAPPLPRPDICHPCDVKLLVCGLTLEQLRYELTTIRASWHDGSVDAISTAADFRSHNAEDAEVLAAIDRALDTREPQTVGGGAMPLLTIAVES